MVDLVTDSWTAAISSSSTIHPKTYKNQNKKANFHGLQITLQKKFLLRSLEEYQADFLFQSKTKFRQAIIFRTQFSFPSQRWRHPRINISLKMFKKIKEQETNWEWINPKNITDYNNYHDNLMLEKKIIHPNHKAQSDTENYSDSINRSARLRIFVQVVSCYSVTV